MSCEAGHGGSQGEFCNRNLLNILAIDRARLAIRKGQKISCLLACYLCEQAIPTVTLGKENEGTPLWTCLPALFVRAWDGRL